ncbi:MAG: putative repeat protein (TIGR01451 family), partial [Myxococcota bacterium]
RARAADILVTNPLPPGLALENATHGGHYDDLADAVVWRLPLLAQGQANKLSWTARVASEFASGATAVTNVAAAALMVGDERISAEAEFTATVVARPELRVGVQLGRLSAHAGETVPCELAWANGGDARASGTTVGVELPAGVSEVHREDGGVLERAGNRVFWPIGSMGPAEEGRAMLLLTLQRPMPRGRVEVPITGVVNSLEVPEIRGIAMLEVQARPVLAVGAIIEQAYARPGDLLHFELQWSNAGGSDAPGGVLAVPLPTGATLASARPEAVLDSSTDTLRWALGDLGAGASGTVRLTLQARTDLEAGETRLVVVPALHAGDDTAEVAEPAEVVIQAAPRLSVELTASDPSPEPGAMVSWAVRLRNVGDAEARRLNLSLPLPQRVTLLSVNGGATRWDPAMRTARVSVGAIPPGDTCDLEVTARLESVFPAGVTPLVVRAEVACDGSPNVWSEPVEVGVRASSQPAVSVVWGAEQATPGQTVEAAITVANTGNADVPSAVLRLELPDGTRVEEGARAEWVGNTLSWSPARLEAGAEQTIAVSLILAPSFAAGTTRALARAVLEMEATDGPDSADVAEVAEEAAIWVHAAPSLSVTLATAIRDVRPGRELPVFVVVSNTGTGPAAAAQLSLALPARCRLSDESTPEDTATAHNVTLDLGDVAAGGRVERELSLTLDPEFPAGTTSLGISASVEADAAAASEDASLTLAVHATADLELSLTPDTATPTLGGVVTWQVHWHNRGDAPATNVRLFVRPAEHTTLEHAGPIEVGTMRPGQRGENVVVTRLLECFPAGESNVSPEVSVACTESPQCRVPTPPLIVSAASDLQVRIESETSVAMAAVGTRVATRSAGSADTVSESEVQMMPVGANLVFTLYITNAGSAPAQDAAVQHDLPPGSQFISASQGGAYDRGAHRVTWSLGTVGPGIEPLVRTATVRFGG